MGWEPCKENWCCRKGKIMKIFLDMKHKHVVIRRMEPYLTNMGHILTFKPNECDVQLTLIKFRRKINVPIVLRLDGIYYDKANRFQSHNSLISKSHRNADGIIYQSKFSMKMCEKYLASRRKNAIIDVIHNGIEADWCGSYINHDNINIVVSAKWRRHKRLKETIDVFLKYLHYYPNAQLHILGILHDNKPFRHPNIRYYGMVDHIKMAKIYRSGDMFIHLSKKDSCPNAVVEAIGAGIPVITTNACGGSSEMCKMTDGCIICKGDVNSLQPCSPYSEPYNKLSGKLEKNLIKAMVEVSSDRRRVKLPKSLDIKTTAKKYVDIMEKVKR